jgi:dTDP-glucose pyrophosphorylase
VAVAKAVVLAAGRGIRLGALTDHTPKPLLQVGGRPVLTRILDGLKSAGIQEVFVVVGYRGDQVERELGNGSGIGLNIQYATQGSAEGTAKAVGLARRFVGADRFFVGWADILVWPDNYERLLRAADETDAAMAVNEVADPTTGAAVYVDHAMSVTHLVEKPAAGTSKTQWNNAGLFVLPNEIWPFIDALQPSSRGEFELPQAIAAYVASGGTVRAVPIDGPWFDIGTPADLEAARRELGNLTS